MLKKVGHISIILLLLVSTMGLTVNLHYCKDKLYDVGIFSEATNCCIDIGDAHEHPGDVSHHHDASHHQQSCDAENHKKSDCEDETLQVESVDDYVVSSFNFDFNNLSFLNIFLSVPVLSDLFNQSSTVVIEIPEWNISPPKIQVVLSLLQTYLI